MRDLITDRRNLKHFFDFSELDELQEYFDSETINFLVKKEQKQLKVFALVYHVT